MDEARFEELLGLYLDGLAGPEEKSELEGLLRENAACRRLLFERVRVEVDLVEMYSTLSESKAGESRPARPADRPGMPTAIRAAKHGRRRAAAVKPRAAARPRRWLRSALIPLGAAAALLLALGLTAIFRAQAVPDDLEATVSQIRGPGAVLIRGDRTDPLRTGSTLRPGDGVRTGKDACVQFRYLDDTVVSLHQGTEVRLGPAEEGRPVHLDSGRLDVAVPKQKPGQRIVFETPHAEAEVLSTRLTLAVSESSTRLEVTEGRVALTRKENRKTVEVGTFQYAVASGDVELVVRPLTVIDTSTPKLEDMPKQTRVSRFGITWTFDHPVAVGRFVNGDRYVVGPVKVVSVDPAPAVGLHGSVLNPPVGDIHGFHSDIVGFAPWLAVTFPRELKPGDALVSSIGDREGKYLDLLGYSEAKEGIKTLAVLTCLEAPVPGDTFRPPFRGTFRRLFRAGQLRRELLPRLAPVGRLWDWPKMERMFERPWFEHSGGGGRFLRPKEHMPRADRELVRFVGSASLMLCLDVPDEEKLTLLVRLVQQGIDWYGALKDRSANPDLADKTIRQGLKWAVIFAGILLDDDDMKHPQGRFAENAQTYYGRSVDGASVLWRWAAGREHEERPPRQWESIQDIYAEKLRRASWAWMAQTLAARLMKAETLWNHPAYFDYMDRWSLVSESPERIKAVRQALRMDDDAFLHLQGRPKGSSFRGAMWREYRRTCAPPSNRSGERVLRTWNEYLKRPEAR